MKQLRRLLWPAWRLRRLWRREDLSGYMDGSARSKFLVDLIAETGLPRDARILELGCGAGRNLRFLHEAGYNDLEGVEINLQEIDLPCPIHRTSIEDFLIKANPRSYDIVFTMAVLEHLPRGSEWVFRDMVRISREFILTIEDERSQTFMHYGRDYGEVFRSLGMVEGRAISCDHIDGLGPDVTARMFHRV